MNILSLDLIQDCSVELLEDQKYSIFLSEDFKQVHNVVMF